MLEQVTLGEIFATLGIFAAAIGSIGVIMKCVASAATKWLRRELQPINDKLDSLSKRVDETELEDWKTILVNFIGDVKRGVELSETERERLHETYQKYTDMGGNSYVHTEIEKLKKQGKI